MNLVNTVRLLQRCQQGDSLAIEQLVNEYRPSIYRLAYSIIDNAEDADEVAQDVLLAALKSLASYRGTGKLTTWLYAITVNVCRDRLRARRARERLTQAMQVLMHLAGEHSATLEDESIRGEGQAAIRQAANALSEKLRVPIILRYYHDLSIVEIAEILGIREGTVCSRLSVARDQLRIPLREIRRFILPERTG
jgi:RNA polymerase sigma-70 factor (ECF subfamily)